MKDPRLSGRGCTPLGPSGAEACWTRVFQAPQSWHGNASINPTCLRAPRAVYHQDSDLALFATLAQGPPVEAVNEKGDTGTP